MRAFWLIALVALSGCRFDVDARSLAPGELRGRLFIRDDQAAIGRLVIGKAGAIEGTLTDGAQPGIGEAVLQGHATSPLADGHFRFATLLPGSYELGFSSAAAPFPFVSSRSNRRRPPPSTS